MIRTEIKQRERIPKTDFLNNCGHENSDLRIEEVEAAISQLSNNSAPSPEEKIFNIMLKKGGETLADGLYYIFQKFWSSGVLPNAFKLDPKVMLPKPGKTDYNSVRSYRPITLESVIGKVMERIICNRLIWKLEVDDGVANTQNAYRKQKSCVQTMIRICNSLSEARSRKEHSIITLWILRAITRGYGEQDLLHKAHAKGVCGRMWIYIKNFLTDR